MIWTLLDDFVHSKSPPDLKSQILAKIAKRNTSPDLNRIADWDDAIQAASKDVQDGVGMIVPPPVVTQRSVEPQLSLWIRVGAIAVAALAATVLGVVFLPEAMKASKNQSNKPDVAGISDPKGKTSNRPKVAENVPAAKEDKQLPRVDRDRVATTDTVKPDVASAKDKELVPHDTKVIASGLAANARKDSEIVRVIDEQLSYLWQRVGVKPAAEVPMEAWLDRITIAVLGRQATAAEKEAFRSNKSENKASEFVDGLVSSGEFARVWSNRLAEHYLGKRIPEKRDNASPESGFIAWLEKSVVQRVAVGELEKQLVSGTGDPSNVPTRAKEAVAYWLAETMERASALQREAATAGSLLKKRDPREEALLGVSRQLMRLSGNPSMVCSQCHSDEAGNSDLRGFIAMVNSKRTGDGSSFWRVPASLSGLSLVYQNSERQLRIESPKSYFFEDADGTMKLVNAGTPSLRKSKQEAEALADWFQGSSEPRRALVEMVWNQVFQQPLVPPTGLSDEEGQAERVDLRDMLADQMQARRADLATLVRWVALSKAMRLEGVKTDTPWYIESTKAKIAATQRQLRILAGYPRVESMQAESGKLAVGKVAAWIDAKRSFETGNSLLAQPSDNASTSKGAKRNKLEYKEDQVRYLISVDEPYSQVKAISERWAKSSMDWSMLVEHAYLATDARFPNRNEREEAAKLLDANDKDRMRTLVMLVNARLGSW